MGLRVGKVANRERTWETARALGPAALPHGARTRWLQRRPLTGTSKPQRLAGRLPTRASGASAATHTAPLTSIQPSEENKNTVALVRSSTLLLHLLLDVRVRQHAVGGDLLPPVDEHVRRAPNHRIGGSGGLGHTGVVELVPAKSVLTKEQAHAELLLEPTEAPATHLLMRLATRVTFCRSFQGALHRFLRFSPPHFRLRDKG